MLTYYPPIAPYSQQHIAVEPPHILYVEECGNPDGVPVIVLHGGPGAGCNEDQRRYFDPNLYRIILFDQRGAGRSTPYAELQNNTTQALVEDIEIIRKTLNIEKWVVYGSSWGSTLSLVYAQTYPERVLGLIVRSIFLARRQDIDWIYGPEGGRRIFPDHWAEFLSILPTHHRQNPLLGYHELLTGKNEVLQMSAAKHWMLWGAQFLNRVVDPQIFQLFEPHHLLGSARIENHYVLHQCFLEPNQILHNMQRIHHLPGIILHGRYDLACPLDNAWSLSKAWSNSILRIIPTAGHTSQDPNMLSAIIHATQELARHLIR